ncbi:hypothetical protein O6H91_14G071900 [Diphasiastrum complanatum]|uniref:Uncharacterized protein n=1 Tax=Diphasiastrum complanatum TaxID=34168 RepID=A0ACC2BRE8_DIPCM|nr:hypothetical protein O6H91_14G071900 [Diphasiastrum complanatum]
MKGFGHAPHIESKLFRVTSLHGEIGTLKIQIHSARKNGEKKDERRRLHVCGGQRYGGWCVCIYLGQRSCIHSGIMWNTSRAYFRGGRATKSVIWSSFQYNVCWGKLEEGAKAAALSLYI